MDTDAHGSDMSLTEGVIGSAFEVTNVLGSGFLEKLYEQALIRELALVPASSGQAELPPPAIPPLDAGDS